MLHSRPVGRPKFSFTNHAWLLAIMHACRSSDRQPNESLDMNGMKAARTSRLLFTIAQYMAECPPKLRDCIRLENLRAERAAVQMSRIGAADEGL